uniref:Uncharacterized protein n=1 Tax=Clytia hemisphaerica TaxID=252671 RepID=A0A7M6DPS3_9CNID
MTWRVLLLVLILHFQGLSSREIYVSQNEASEDIKTCGIQTHPCQTISYAISISKHNDTILLDAEYTYIQNETLIIDTSLKFTSYYNRHGSKAKILFEEGKFPIDYLIQSSANISFYKLQIFSQLVYQDNIFKMGKKGCSLIIEHCVLNFSQPLESDFIDYTKDFKSALIVKTTLHSQKNKIQNTIKKAKGVIKETSIDYHASITFDDCHFVNQIMAITFQRITVNRSILIDSLLSSNPIKDLQLHQSQFFRSSVETTIEYGRLSVTNCTFQGSSEYGDQEGDYAFMLQVHPGDTNYWEGTIRDCTFKRASYGAVKLERGSVELINLTFADNYISDQPMIPTDRAAALTTRSTDMDLVNCTFNNNSARSNQAGSIFTKLGTGERPYTSVSIVNTVVNSIRSPLFNDIRSIWIEPSIYSYPTGWLEITKTSKLNCFEGSYIYEEFESYQYLRLHCITCNSSSYNANGHAFITGNERADNITVHNINCHLCPYQASCKDGIIRSKGNFWGLADSSGKVTFYSCPPLYCCSSFETCKSYNTCARNREGRLCGDCQKGHVLSLFSHNECMDKSCCEYSWTVWLGYILMAALICLFFLFNKDVWNYIRNKNKNVETEESLLDNDDNNKLLITSSPFRKNLSPSYQLPGIIKITFFFYQTASIIRVVASAKTYYHMPNFVSFLFTFFNIKLDFTSSFIKICPLCTNSMVVMDALKSSLSLACLAILLLAMIICVALNFIIKKRLKDGNTQVCEQPILRRLKGAYVNVLLLSYSNISVFCLRNIHCVEVAGESYLCIQASIKCYTDWQYLIMVVIGLWVVPFPLVLYTGCRALRSYRISPNEFLFILTLPPLSLYFMVIRPLAFTQYHFVFDQVTLVEKDQILGVLNGPFKLNLKNQESHLIWEPVLILRRLLLIAMTTFISSPIVKLYPVGLLFFSFAVHDFVQKPFNNQKLNFFQNVSMLLLCLLT